MPRNPDAHPDWSLLMAAAQDGDREAYAAFLHAVIPVLREQAQRNSCDPENAERVVQATLVSIHRLRHTYDPRRPVTPWLAGILAAHAPRKGDPERSGWPRRLLAWPTWLFAAASDLEPA